MKKMLSAALALAVALGLLAGCSGAPASSAASVSGAPAVSSSAAAGSAAPESTGTPAAERTAFRIASLKGPTTMGLVKLMDEADKGEARHDYEVTMYGAADEIAPQLIKGDIDVALVPCNLAGVLYNKTGGAVEVAAVTTGDDITSVADLAGKTIYTTGKGTTPEYVLNYVLTQNGLTPGEDVTIEYMSEATEVLAAMQASSGYPVAMLPQPYVTTAQMQMEGLKVALDMTEEWDKVSPDSALVTGVVVARKEFVEQNEAAFNEFLEDYKASTEFVNANVDEAAALDRLQAQRTAADAECLESVRQEIGKLRRRVYELEQMTAKLYEDKVCGSISAASFAVLLEKTEQERRQRTDRLDTLLAEIREYEQSAADIQSWAAVVRKHLHIRELDRETVDELIDRIEVGEKTVVDGKNVRDIKIYYRFVGNI